MGSKKGRKVKQMSVALLEKPNSDYEMRQQYLQRARMLHENISEKMGAAAITHREIEKDVRRACSDVRRTNNPDCS